MTKSKKQKFYVVAQYLMRPRNKNMTSNAAYMQNPDNLQFDEMFNIVTKIKDKELQTYSVILDLTEKKIVKNSYQSGKTYQEILQYFTSNYSEKFTQMLGEYINEIKDFMPIVASNSEPAPVVNQAEFKIGKAEPAVVA